MKKKKSPPPAPPAAESPAAIPAEPAKRVPIVGIGASAGGLEALTQLLSRFTSDPGLAIVVIQHLERTHESSLAELLATATKLPVVQVNQDMPVEANHVYVIAPNRALVLKQDTLIVQPRALDRTQYTPIDVFFQSLAKERAEEAIGVILSGTASDGVEGVHAIKAAGGKILVQAPESARFDSMPRHAIATGKVDFVLTPQEIAHELAQLAEIELDPGSLLLPMEDDSELTPANLEEIFKILQVASGVDFRQYKLPTVRRRIRRRMNFHNARTASDYIQRLHDNGKEALELYQEILIHVTRFFREPDSFTAIKQEVLPSILESRKGDSPLRIWVPACSTGEEPYSVAMAVMECLDERSENIPMQIFATDLSETAIEQARAGIYPTAISEDVPADRLRRFFSKVDGSYRINKNIRDACVFARQDLTRDPPFSKLDLIVCRNVMIYLGQAVQSRLINVFHYALKPTGYLILGAAETIGPHIELFAVADKKHRVYRKKPSEASTEVQFSVSDSHYRPGVRGPRVVGEPREGGGVQTEANRLILDRYAPPGVIVNEELRIIQFRGQTGKFLEPAPGDASLNLLKMCREGLLHSLRTALQEAKKSNAPARREGLRVKTNGHSINAAVEVTPLATAGEARHYLVMFQEIGPVESETEPAKTLRRRKGKTDDSQQEIERLQKELVAGREYLQSIIQDLEAANEELQSANEEILSSNEELQSTNEELDTAKEELQSTNEELNTVNEELHGRNEELARINSDLVNLLNGVQIAIVIVTSDLRIRRFTPVAEKILNLIPGDIGRPISQIKPNINCPDLEHLLTQAIDNISVQHRDVRDAQGRLYSLTVRPYKNIDNRIDGAVLALFDIDDVRRHEEKAQETRAFCELVFQSAPCPMLVLDKNLRIEEVNRAFCERFQTTEAAVEAKQLLELRAKWLTAKFKSALESSLSGDHDGEPSPSLVDGDGQPPYRLFVRRWDGNQAGNTRLLLVMDFENPS